MTENPTEKAPLLAVNVVHGDSCVEPSVTCGIHITGDNSVAASIEGFQPILEMKSQDGDNLRVFEAGDGEPAAWILEVPDAPYAMMIEMAPGTKVRCDGMFRLSIRPRPPAGDGEAVIVTDWLQLAKLAGEHGIRYRTNSALERFLADVTPLYAHPPANPNSGAEDGVTQGDRSDEADRIAKLLMREWSRVDPESGPAKYPASYVATFVDLAYAVIADRHRLTSANTASEQEKALAEAIAAVEEERLCDPQNDEDGAYDRAIDDAIAAIRSLSHTKEG